MASCQSVRNSMHREDHGEKQRTLAIAFVGKGRRRVVAQPRLQCFPALPCRHRRGLKHGDRQRRFRQGVSGMSDHGKIERIER